MLELQESGEASQDPELIEEIRRELQREVDGVTLDAYIQSHDAEAIASQGSGLYVIDRSGAQVTEQETLIRICNEARKEIGWPAFDDEGTPEQEAEAVWQPLRRGRSASPEAPPPQPTKGVKRYGPMTRQQHEDNLADKRSRSQQAPGAERPFQARDAGASIRAQDRLRAQESRRKQIAEARREQQQQLPGRRQWLRQSPQPPPQRKAG